MTGKAGQSITFTWDNNHNVFIHPSGDCDATGAILVGNESPATYTFTEDDEGETLHFVCTVGQHCQNGMHMDVAVEASEGDTSDAISTKVARFTAGIGALAVSLVVL